MIFSIVPGIITDKTSSRYSILLHRLISLNLSMQSEEKVECSCSKTFHFTYPETNCDITCPVQQGQDKTFCGDEDRMLVYDTAGNRTLCFS